MNTQTTTTGPGPVFLEDFTIYPEAREVYAHNVSELFQVQDLTIEDLNRLHSDLINEIGPDRAGQVMQQLTANK